MTMKWWKAKKTAPRNLHPFVVETLHAVNNKMISCAQFLQHKTNRLSVRTLKAILAAFCFLIVGGCTYLIISSLQRDKKNLVQVTPIQALPLFKESIRQSASSGNEYKKIYQFKIYLDSLNKTDKGRVIRDSFLFARPHLMDSLTYLQKFYYLQNKN